MVETSLSRQRTTRLSNEEFLLGAIQAETLAVDTEGTKLKTKKDLDKGITDGTDYRDGTGFAYGISMAYRDEWGDIQSAYFAIKHTRDNVSPEFFARLKYLIENHPQIVFHNIQHDLYAMDGLGINLQDKDNWYCTLNMVQWINENEPSKRLDDIAKKLLGVGKEDGPEWKAALTIFGWTPSMPVSAITRYACIDTERTLEVFEILFPEFIRQGFDG